MQKRPTTNAKETYYICKRDLLYAKETCYIAKETYYKCKRDLYNCWDLIGTHSEKSSI